jgi:hypothetical protein
MSTQMLWVGVLMMAGERSRSNPQDKSNLINFECRKVV